MSKGKPTIPAGSQIARHLPFLRRYARALTGSQRRGDELVRQLLETALGDGDSRAALKGGRTALFAAFARHWQGARTLAAPTIAAASTNPASTGAAFTGAVSAREAAADAHLASVEPRRREALLLIALERFSSQQAGDILGITAAQAAALAEQAARDIARDTAASVLIIEDEPLISLQIEQIVTSLGLTISGIAATREIAARSAAASPPGLVLADIQLADGSSGLDAVADILAATPHVPVIFITAYPERLLTGDRPEPTYLLSKPFHEDAVRAAISQALFFAQARRA